jgi:hypothetical protein
MTHSNGSVTLRVGHRRLPPPPIKLEALDLIDGNGEILYTERYPIPREVVMPIHFVGTGAFTQTIIYGPQKVPVSGQFVIRYKLPRDSQQLKTGSVFLGESFAEKGVFMVLTYTAETVDLFETYLNHLVEYRKKKRYGYL